jgi:hypothetical protein
LTGAVTSTATYGVVPISITPTPLNALDTAPSVTGIQVGRPSPTALVENSYWKSGSIDVVGKDYINATSHDIRGSMYMQPMDGGLKCVGGTNANGVCTVLGQVNVECTGGGTCLRKDFAQMEMHAYQDGIAYPSYFKFKFNPLTGISVGGYNDNFASSSPVTFDSDSGDPSSGFRIEYDDTRYATFYMDTNWLQLNVFGGNRSMWLSSSSMKIDGASSQDQSLLVTADYGKIPLKIRNNSDGDSLLITNQNNINTHSATDPGDFFVKRLVGVGSTTPSAATCVDSSSDRLYGDIDCSHTKDSGEEFLDFTGDVEAVGDCASGDCYQTVGPNLVYAGAASGTETSAAAFRALAAADMSALTDPYFNLVGVGSTTPSAATCIAVWFDGSYNRLYKDANCDTYRQGEFFEPYLDEPAPEVETGTSILAKIEEFLGTTITTTTWESLAKGGVRTLKVDVNDGAIGTVQMAPAPLVIYPGVTPDAGYMLDQVPPDDDEGSEEFRQAHWFETRARGNGFGTAYLERMGLVMHAADTTDGLDASYFEFFREFQEDGVVTGGSIPFKVMGTGHITTAHTFDNTVAFAGAVNVNSTISDLSSSTNQGAWTFTSERDDVSTGPVPQDAFTFKQGSSSNASKGHTEWTDASNNVMMNLTDGGTTGALTVASVVGALTGNASTATALAANGGNCSAGSFPLGVDASGAVESCATVASLVPAAETDSAHDTAAEVGAEAADADLTDLADGLLTSTKVGAGTNCYSWSSVMFNPTENATSYVRMYSAGAPNTPNATETVMDVSLSPPVAITFTSLGVLMGDGIAPAGSDSWIVTIRDDGADIATTSATCTITGANTSCTWSGTSGSVAALSKINLKVVGSATVAASIEMMVSWCTAP